MDGDHSCVTRSVVFSFSLIIMACSGHHISLRLLSLLRVIKISPSPKQRGEKERNGWEVIAGGIEQSPGPRGGALAGDTVTATP